MSSDYDWDRGKADDNLRKHGVTLAEGATVEDDPLRRSWPDKSLIWGEARFVTIGLSKAARLLVVVTSESGPRPRIISARRATKREQHAYETRP